MDERDDYAEPDARPPWVRRFLVRRVLPVGAAVLLIATVMFLTFGLKLTDRHYSTYVSILEAESLAKICHLKRGPDGRCPAKSSDLSGTVGLTDARGKPFRYAVVPNEAGEPEPHVWAERTEDDGRITLVGAYVKADGTVVRFGLPPKD